MANGFAEAKTTVFWDVEDFPNPDGKSIYEIIKSALENLGYRGEVSIKAYGEKKPDNLNVDDDSVIAFAPKRGKHARLNKMFLDICLWSLCCFDDRSDRANLLVIAKTNPKDTLFNSMFVSELRDLHQRRNGNVLLVVANDCAPEETPLPKNVSTIWFWESLLDGGKPLSSIQVANLLAGVEDEPKYDGSEEDEDDDSSEEDEDDDGSGDEDDCRLCHKLHEKLVVGGGLEGRSMFSVKE